MFLLLDTYFMYDNKMLNQTKTGHWPAHLAS